MHTLEQDNKLACKMPSKHLDREMLDGQIAPGNHQVVGGANEAISAHCEV